MPEFQVGQKVIVSGDENSEFAYVFKGQVVVIEKVFSGMERAISAFPEGNTVLARSADGNQWQLSFLGITPRDSAE